MFDLLEEYVSTQEQQGGESTGEKSARTFDSRSAALFSMPEKFIQKEDTEKKKNHPLIPILSVFIVVLIVASVALAFIIQNKNLQTAEEKARQEAARVVALQNAQKQSETTLSEENIPFQINENNETTTSTETVTSSSSTSTESTSPSLLSVTSTDLINSSVQTLLSSPTTTNQEIVIFGEDSDKDKLSDVEERMYKTDQKKPDTDMDGILDGAEVKNLYDPTKGESALLKNSGLVDIFSNTTYQYTFFYPKLPDEWAVGVVDQSQKEVLATAATGEYISVRVEDNPQKLSVLDWYTMVYATGKPAESMQSMFFGQWNALMREDGMVYYLVRKDERGGTLTPYVYVLSYTSNAKKELNYFTTFQMLVKSFSPLEIVVTIEQ